MYVCVCRAVTEKQLYQAIDDGADTVWALKDKLQVSECCGACLDTVKECLQERGQQSNGKKYKLRLVG